MKKEFLFIALAALLAFSCTTVVPVNGSNSQGLAIFQAESSITNWDEIFVVYEIVINSKIRIRIDPTQQHLLLTNLPLGTNTITSFDTLNKENTDELPRNKKIGYDFIVEPGKVTIIPLKLVIDREITPEGEAIYSGLVKLNSSDREKAIKYFKRQKNSETWGITQ